MHCHKRAQRLRNEKQMKSKTLPIGSIKIIPFSEDIPEGWSKMRIDQGRMYKQELMQLLNQWSIVAFELGALTGRGYGGNFWQHYGGQCGEGFIIKRN